MSVRYGVTGRAATVRIEREVEVDGAAVEEAVRRLGRRVYATNAPAEQLSLEQGVLKDFTYDRPADVCAI